MTRQTLGVFTSTGVTGYKGIRVTFCNVFKWRKVTLIPLYPVTPVLVNTPINTRKDPHNYEVKIINNSGSNTDKMFLQLVRMHTDIV